MRTKGDAARVAAEAIRKYRAQAREFESEMQSLKVDGEAVDAEINQVRLQLCEALLPGATNPILQRVDNECCSKLLPERQKFESYRAQWSSRLLEIQNNEDFSQRAQLLESGSGELSAGRAELRRQVEAFRALMTSCDKNADFRWVLSREPSNRSGGALQTFWRGLTFASTRENHARQKVVAALDVADWDSLRRAYDRAKASLVSLLPQLQAADERYETLSALMLEFADCEDWVHHFEERLCQELRQRLVIHLGRDKTTANLHRAIRPELLPLVARHHGLLHKELYLRQMAAHAKGQMTDRNRRADQLDRTRRLWERKPCEVMWKSKQKWLVTVPALKEASTAKHLRWIRAAHRNVLSYQDWDRYGLYLKQMPSFLPYDAFGWGSEDSMPYEGFSAQVFPDLARQRRSHRQTRADYSEFKQLDKGHRPARAGAAKPKFAKIPESTWDEDELGPHPDSHALLAQAALAATVHHQTQAKRLHDVS